MMASGACQVKSPLLRSTTVFLPRADSRAKSVCSSFHTLLYSDGMAVFSALSTINGRLPRLPAALASAVLRSHAETSCKSAECALADWFRYQTVFHSEGVMPF